jgi:hypothetical protein
VTVRLGDANTLDPPGCWAVCGRRRLRISSRRRDRRGYANCGQDARALGHGQRRGRGDRGGRGAEEPSVWDPVRGRRRHGLTPLWSIDGKTALGRRGCDRSRGLAIIRRPAFDPSAPRRRHKASAARTICERQARLRRRKPIEPNPALATAPGYRTPELWVAVTCSYDSSTANSGAAVSRSTGTGRRGRPGTPRRQSKPLRCSRNSERAQEPVQARGNALSSPCDPFELATRKSRLFHAWRSCRCRV